MPRVLWKGAIAFGLVHVPVGLYPASHDDSIDFDWLDERTMDPVGYKRINKRTGREIDKEHIVKGIKQDDEQYVVLSDDEIKAAYPSTTQTIEIDAFVKADEIPFVHLDRPYYLAPVDKGAKVYALLREALVASQRVGVARVVIQTKQHLAVLVPVGAALMLNTLRWPSEIRPWDELELPPAGSRGAGLNDKELGMARQLIDDMSTDWDPDRYRSTFKEAIMALVDKKLAAGDVHAVEAMEAAPEDSRSSNVVDLTELLKRSLGRGRAGGPAPEEAEPAWEKPGTRSASKPTSKAPAKRSASGAHKPPAKKAPAKKQASSAARKRA